MTDYTKLVAALRYCAETPEEEKDCNLCEYYPKCSDVIAKDAADAIEVLQKTLKAVQTNSGINKYDAFRMLEEAQAEVERLVSAAEQVERLVSAAEKEGEPKRGEWIEADGFYKCSVCGELECCRGKYCPDCGAKMEGGNDVQ